MTYQLITIILPVYNQADHVADVVETYKAGLARIPVAHELLLVVNGSRDSSLEVCQRLAQQSPTVKVIHSQAGGWGMAVRLGLTQAQGDLICYTNLARTSVQDLTLMLLYALTNPQTIIKANRKIRESWQRRIGSLLYNIECRTLFDLAYWDINGTPKVFPSSFAPLKKLTRDDDLIDLEFHVICRENQYPVLEVPIFSSRRHGGNSTTNYHSAWKMYLGCYQLWLSRRKPS